MKKLLLGYLVRFLGGATALGIGVWYISYSLNDDASLGYASLDGFMNSIGVTDGNIANANGCFLCRYVGDLFNVLGDASERFWNFILHNLWILMVVGFVIFLFVHTIKHIYKSMTDTTKLDASEIKFQFAPWFDTVWRTGLRIMIVGAIIGAFGMGGVGALKTLSNITITPVMYIGTQLAMAATGISDAAQCHIDFNNMSNAMIPVSDSFMCIIGNINSVILAGASGGFALMNYAWMGLGGGAFSWIAGLLIVLMFVIIGFDLFFQILSVVFRLVFLIMFLPLLVAATAFEKTWNMAGKVLNGAVDTLVKSAVQVIGIALKVVIVFSTVYFAADEFYPGPVDGYSALLPPLLGQTAITTDPRATSVQAVFAKCESIARVGDDVDTTAFRECFKSERQIVESHHPDAFGFMHDGWGFLILMIGLFFLYFYVLAPRVDQLLVSVPSFEPFKKSGDKESGGLDDFGGELKKFGKLAWKKPQDWLEKIIKES